MTRHIRPKDVKHTQCTLHSVDLSATVLIMYNLLLGVQPQEVIKTDEFEGLQ